MLMKLAKNSKLYITKGAALYLGSVLDTDFHKHHALQITLADKKEFIIKIRNETIQTRSLLLNSNCEHMLIGKDDAQALLLIEPETTAGKVLRKYLGNNPFRIFVPNTDICELIKSKLHGEACLFNIINLMISHLDIDIDFQLHIDERINKVLKIIDGTDEKKLRINDLARYISLSASRLQHIFKGQTGISIKKYLKWKRLIDGINIIAGGKNFTFASHESGFADSAHMSRTFKDMFGINLSDIFHNSRSIQVFICKN